MNRLETGCLAAVCLLMLTMSFVVYGMELRRGDVVALWIVMLGCVGVIATLAIATAVA